MVNNKLLSIVVAKVAAYWKEPLFSFAQITIYAFFQ